jgi:hypothetical protein
MPFDSSSIKHADASSVIARQLDLDSRCRRLVSARGVCSKRGWSVAGDPPTASALCSDAGLATPELTVRCTSDNER